MMAAFLWESFTALSVSGMLLLYVNGDPFSETNS